MQSLERFSYDRHQVHHIFIDDFPLKRDTEHLTSFARSYGFDEIIMHEENMGITRTWQSFYELIKDRDYDYIFQHEDDVELLYSISISELIAILRNDKQLSQVQLARNHWYSHEKPCAREVTDILFDKYRYYRTSEYFWSMFSVYPMWIVNEPIREKTGYHVSESVIAWYLKDNYDLQTGIVKTFDGSNMIEHIGEYFQGTRTVENEPGWERFKNYTEKFKYCSKTGQILHEN